MIRRRRRAVPLALAASLLTAVVIGLAAWGVMRPAPQPPAPLASFVVTTPTAALFNPSALSRNIAISPDGTRIVYRASADGTNHLYVRPVDQLEGYPLFSVPDSIDTPTVSPDGAWVVFATAVDRTWKKVSILGGRPSRCSRTPAAVRPVAPAGDRTTRSSLPTIAVAPGCSVARQRAATRRS